MAGVRRALIVATDTYSDSRLTSLKAPATDASALAEVLRDDAVGCFEVQTVLNRPSHEVELAIAEFFAAGRYGDTLLAHFSCHGVKSPTGELYFATSDTDLSDTFRLKVTGVPSALVRDAMEESRASLILCLVDCCYSGAFVKLAKAADTLDLTERLGGKGRAVITASTSLQLALDGQEEPSLFTHAVIEGLRSGEADRDLDGLVSLDELYSFVHEKVTARNPDQTPVKSFDVQGEVYVARRSTPVTTPAALDPALLADARAPVTYQRLGAVRGLADVVAEGHPGRSLAARLELERLAGSDDSLSVRAEAKQVLDGAGSLPVPTIPELDASVPTRGTAGVDGATDPDSGGAGGAGGGTTGTGSSGRGAPGAPGVDLPGRDRPSWWRRGPAGRRRVMAVTGVVAVLGVAGIAWWAAAGDDGGGSSAGSSAGGSDVGGAVLPDTELLVAGDDPQLGKGILAFDVRTGQTRMVVADPTAVLPTVSEDRQWMVYLARTSGGNVPHLARVDGSEDGRLLDRKVTRACPYTTRPAFSPDGGFLAIVCYDASGTVLGLGVVDRDGHAVRELSTSDDIRGSPTWTGDDRIVFARDLHGDDVTSLWVVPAGGGDARSVTDGRDGSDSHPDWSERGLLFLRTRGDSSNVVYEPEVGARGVTTVTTSGTAESPTWAPSDEPAVVWLEPATGDGAKKTLFLTKLGDTAPTELNTAVYGPPAWGSR